MSTPQEIAEQAISKIEAEEAGIDTTPKVVEEKESDATKDTTNDSDVDANKSTEEDEASESSNSNDKPTKEDKKEAGTFTADDALEVDEKREIAQSPTDNAGIVLSPSEQKHIIDNIGNPLVIRGMQGDKEVELKVYQPGEIPADFKFRSDADMITAQNGLIGLERKAEQLLGNFRNDQSNAAAKDFEQRENQGIIMDVADLQKAGDFPKFVMKPGEAGFDDTAEAKQMAEVMNVMTERNKQYMAEYQQGRPYRHIGFREAFEMHQAKNPAIKKEAAQVKEDTERKQVADKIGINRGLTTDTLRKATVRSGTRVEDILNRVESEW